jgi:hydroxymethylpyrimidine/phosphomethylpyrimidine kinase
MPPAILIIGAADMLGRDGSVLRASADRAGIPTVNVTTAVTWNGPRGFRFAKTPHQVLRTQIDAACHHRQILACLVGFIPDAEGIELIRVRLERRGVTNVVLQPVICGPDGERLIGARAVSRLERLLERSTAVVAEQSDAELLAGGDPGDDPDSLARTLSGSGARIAMVFETGRETSSSGCIGMALRPRDGTSTLAFETGTGARAPMSPCAVMAAEITCSLAKAELARIREPGGVPDRTDLQEASVGSARREQDDGSELPVDPAR